MKVSGGEVNESLKFDGKMECHNSQRLCVILYDMHISGNNVYTLRMNNKSCNCGKWQAYTLPSSHALAVSRENDMRADTYVPYIYSRETYRRTYQSNFYSVGHKDFWRVAPYNLTFDPPNMNNERGRKQGTRFRGKMDYRNLDSPTRCTRCSMPGHNRKNYNNPGSSNV
ncbi:hypothetical protein M9H77_21374 [Catharanthus roseus]|uniref:Uncharacterized protein n=1 Tax=Catharanthus roseus TaxID=4058 RepID=A0ACC0AMW0_CATRO|nr:hypothetical protein M9H77_21374 [Catharanthus roseus]